MSRQRLPTPTHSPEESLPVTSEDPNVVLSWLRELIRQARLAWNLFWDSRVPWPPKLIPPVVLLYLLSPIDIIPDPTLGLGQLDDLAVLLLGTKLFVELCPVDLVREHLKALGSKIEEWQAGEVIEGEFEVREAGEVVAGESEAEEAEES